ncbi:DUF485 domain-containing protein [Moraxella sp. FZLJ2107]|uniref:DUF485 domain-containing protein n=1 Tax=unclassified Moraxella TaxID=2685852 RepID=UPI0020C86C4A|nr:MULTISPECIES: DUF485 domain-containing protein [unclassified Moraxella]UTO05867.1 DUF485 domain-containing protein [Moraxella sp. FZLJ2107]UTO22603.1 DUF485 domain-containing protein [Moraxella sp. FZLJ2109]
MNEAQVKSILENPKFKTLVAKKRNLSWSLTVLMLFIYIGFTLLVAYNPEFLRTSISGGVITWGIPLGIGVIVISFVLCGVYSSIANNSFDKLNKEAIEEVEAIAFDKGVSK